MPIPPEPLACHLCGSQDQGNRITLRAAAWATPREDKWFATIPRCRDSQACRERCETAGDVWPLTDTTVPMHRVGEEATPAPLATDAPLDRDLLEEGSL